jgi:hypothetical protein
VLDRLEQEAGEKAQSAEAVASQAKADLLASLEAKAFFWIARGREANIELGRVFNQIRDVAEHGSWEDYYKTKFEPHGVAFRTAQWYMKLAREADELTKNANSALFPPATDPQAQAINAAAEQAKQDVANASGDAAAPSNPNPEPKKKSKKSRKARVRLNGLYWLPLQMKGDEKDSTDQLVKSQNWHGAHMEIMALLRRLHVKYGIVADPATLPAQVAAQSRKHLELPPEDPYQATDGDLPSALFEADLPFDEVPDNANAAA